MGSPSTTRAKRINWRRNRWSSPSGERELSQAGCRDCDGRLRIGLACPHSARTEGRKGSKVPLCGGCANVGFIGETGRSQGRGAWPTGNNFYADLPNGRRASMTILVAYVPRPEGEAALEKGLEIAQREKERMVVVHSSPGARARICCWRTNGISSGSKSARRKPEWRSRSSNSFAVTAQSPRS